MWVWCVLMPPLAPLAGLVTMSLGLASFSLAGLYCNHADLSPRYASVLLGITNTSGALPGIVGVAITGAGGRAPGCLAASSRLVQPPFGRAQPAVEDSNPPDPFSSACRLAV